MKVNWWGVKQERVGVKQEGVVVNLREEVNFLGHKSWGEALSGGGIFLLLGLWDNLDGLGRCGEGKCGEGKLVGGGGGRGVKQEEVNLPEEGKGWWGEAGSDGRIGR